jgi:hypothetical protein
MNDALQHGRAAGIWDVLISQARESQTITYKALAEEINVHPRALRHALEVIQKYCFDNKLPHLTTLVINSYTGVPGAGNNLDKSQLKAEYQRIFTFNWRELLNPFNNENSKNTHIWWAGDLGEKFWVESTDRVDLGKNLLSPISSNAGQKLVTFVENGDVIFHYYQPIKSIVAFSVASGSPRVGEIRWPDRKKSKISPAYEIDLINFTELDEPISLNEIQAQQESIRAIKLSLDKRYDGGAIYFPFQIPKEKVIQPAQGAYLTKMPKALVDLFPTAVAQIERDIAPEISRIKSTIQPKSKIHPSPTLKLPVDSSHGIQTDEKKKKATELWGMELATKYLKNLGYNVEDVSTQKKLGYDIRAVKKGEVVGVEVKSSILSRIQVDVTAAEVGYAKFAGEEFRSLLYVVDQIVCTKDGDSYKTSGGRERFWWDWNPDANSLSPIEYRFTLPPIA